MYPFDTHARVFRTAAAEPSAGNGSTCADTLAIAIVSADESYLVCGGTNSVSLVHIQPGQAYSCVWSATAA